ncbi:MAG: phosphate transport system protein [Solirubrobacteraceae bacterium]|jgi:phosphate transport system protein|nr:phosphate transport system protein [Solirubrobacteraceae bacterium]MEA2355394.1 phosphate transport system protein [Solirubrobacteraceae bacterium]
MRNGFHEQLAAIERSVVENLELAAATLAVVARVVADTSTPTPSSIEVAAQVLKNGARAVDTDLLTTIALQAPVAGDLRLTMALMHIAHHQSLIANQFVLITAQLMETDPDVPAVPHTAARLVRMAELAAAELAKATEALGRRDAELARAVADDDDVVDQLNREVFAATVFTGGGELERDVAMRQMLIARSLERIADNAVDIAEQAAFLVTGELCEFSDASHPQDGAPA